VIVRNDEYNTFDHVAESLARTPPTLSGTTLFVRDRKTIQALELK